MSNKYGKMREKLLRTRDMLVEDVRDIERRIADPADYVPFDDAEQGVVDAEKEMQFSLLSHKEAQLNRIDEALGRLARGKYGLCRLCSRRIRPRRLRAVPSAEYCVSCQHEYERETAPDNSPRGHAHFESYSTDGDAGCLAAARSIRRF